MMDPLLSMPPEQLACICLCFGIVIGVFGTLLSLIAADKHMRKREEG
jgi:hypothetical protein